METKGGGDIEKINKFTGYQLPNTFKIVGLLIVIVSILSIVTSLHTYILDDKFYNLFKRIALSGIVVGLLMISISKEKVEDELIAKIRMQSYIYAVLGVVIFYLLIPFIGFVFFLLFSSTSSDIEASSDLSVLSVLLFSQIIAFRKLKKAYNEE